MGVIMLAAIGGAVVGLLWWEHRRQMRDYKPDSNTNWARPYMEERERKALEEREQNERK